MTSATETDTLAVESTDSPAAATSKADSIPQSCDDGVMDESSEPISKVLIIRNLPPTCTEEHLKELSSRVGGATTVHHAARQRLGFIELSDVTRATALLEHIRSEKVKLQGRTIFANYSNYQKIMTSPHVERNSSASGNPPSCVLLVSVLECVYPVNVDVLQQVFGRFGGLERIVIFSREENVSALVQFNSIETATAAKYSLHGQCIYTNCNKLCVYFSRMKHVVVKYNNEKSRDFTDPTLPAAPMMDMYHHTGQSSTMPGVLSGTPASMTNLGGLSPVVHSPAMSNVLSRMATLAESSAVLFVSGINEQRTSVNHLFNLFGVYGDVVRVKILYNRRNHALIQFAHPIQAEMARTYLHRTPLHGNILAAKTSSHYMVTFNEHGGSNDLCRDYSNSRLHRFRTLEISAYNRLVKPHEVLLISNIATDTTKEELITLLGTIGQVTVNFIREDRHVAVAAYNTVNDATSSLAQYHGHNLHGRDIRISFARPFRKREAQLESQSE